MDTEQRLKNSAAQAFEAVLRAEGYRIQLGGGGGATALGGPRPVKDLDFKMGAELKTQWRNDDKRNQLCQKIKNGLKGYGYELIEDNFKSKKQLRYVMKIKIRDKASGEMKISTYRKKEETHENKRVIGHQQIEISLTTSGIYDEHPQWESKVGPAQFMHPVNPTQLILDKVYVLAQRPATERDKMLTDFEDLAALLATHDKSVTRELLEVREQGYKKAAGRDSKMAPTVTEQVRNRLIRLNDDLKKPQPWSAVTDPKLVAIEAKHKIERVHRFLSILDRVLDVIT